MYNAFSASVQWLTSDMHLFSNLLPLDACHVSAYQLLKVALHVIFKN